MQIENYVMNPHADKELRNEPLLGLSYPFISSPLKDICSGAYSRTLSGWLLVNQHCHCDALQSACKEHSAGTCLGCSRPHLCMQLHHHEDPAMDVNR